MPHVIRTSILTVLTLTIVLMGAMESMAARISWMTSSAQARTEANQLGQPLLVYVGSASCGYCRKLDQNTWSDSSVGELVDAKFVALKVDGQRNAGLVRQLRVRSFPTVIVFSANGKYLGQHSGYLDARGMLSFLRQSTINTQARASVAPEQQQ